MMDKSLSIGVRLEMCSEVLRGLQHKECHTVYRLAQMFKAQGIQTVEALEAFCSMLRNPATRVCCGQCADVVGELRDADCKRVQEDIEPSVGLRLRNMGVLLSVLQHTEGSECLRAIGEMLLTTGLRSDAAVTKLCRVLRDEDTIIASSIEQILEGLETDEQ